MTTTKKCSMCAETISLAASTCEYCGAQFEVTITGYCTNCHQVREADPQGCCKVCNREIIDSRVESRFIDEPGEQPLQPVEPKTSPAAPGMQKNRVWVWVLGSVVILGIVASAFGLAPRLAPVFAPDTATPTLTATPLPSATPTSTRTPRPTPTNTPVPAWFIEFNEFAGPILESIKDRPPDFHDDFSGVQRWQFNAGGDSENGSLEFRDGSLEMSITSNAATEGVGFATNSNVLYNSFVLQVDVDLSQLARSDALEIDWRGAGDGAGIVLSLWKDGRWQVTFCGSCYPLLMDGYARVNSAEPISVTILSKDTQYALLLDNVPVGYVDDVGRRPARRIQLSLWVEEGGHTSSVKYSNLKIWDISKLSIP